MIVVVTHEDPRVILRHISRYDIYSYHSVSHVNVTDFHLSLCLWRMSRATII